MSINSIITDLQAAIAAETRAAVDAATATYADRVAALTAQVETLTARVKELEAPPPAPPQPVGRGWLSGAGSHEVGNTDPAKYLGDWRGSPIEIGTTWVNSPDVWGINPAIANSWANFSRAMCLAYAPADFTGGYAAIARGDKDAWWTACARKARELRAGKGQTYFAPFYEFNGDWMAYSATRTAQGMADFRAAFARVAAIWRREFPAVRIVLAPDQGRDLPDAMTPDPASFDLLGGTNYNAWPWSPAGSAAMDRLERYRMHAARLGKPVGITEWANSANASQQGGGGDAPEFIRAMHAWLTKHRGNGPGQVEFETYFNIRGYALDHLLVETTGKPSATQPLAAAAYRDLW